MVYLKNTCVITALSIGSFSNDYDNINENDNGKETRIDLFSLYVFLAIEVPGELYLFISYV